MRTIQFREAICEAMSEEMRRDESIYLMGEEVVTTLKSNGLPVVFEEKKSKSSGMKYHDMVIKA